MAADIPRPGWVADALKEEFPRLAVRWTVVAREEGAKLTGRSPRGVRERLRLISSRMTGGRAVNMRQEAIPAAYRIFFRQIGIDPDDTHTPPEQAALDRMRHGEFRSYGLMWDAVTIATGETGVGVFALDADTVSGEPGLRLTAPGETLGKTELVEGEGAWPLSEGQIVLADSEGALAILFGRIAPEHEVTKETKRAMLLSVRVGGVPDISVEEALWLAAELVEGMPS